jgi:hypothetical protein
VNSDLLFVKTKVFVKEKIERMSEEAVAYLASVLLAIVAGITGNQSWQTILFGISVALLIYGTGIYLMPKFKTLWQAGIGKLIVSILVFSCTTFCMLFAQQAINNSLGVPTSPFLYTQSLLALVVSPFVIALGFVFFGLFFIVVLMPFLFIEYDKFSLKGILFFWNWQKEKLPEVPFLGFFRYISVFTVFGLCVSFLQNNQWYSSMIDDLPQKIAFNFEMDEHSYCVLEEGERVAYLTDMRIIKGRKNEENYEFEVVDCVPKTNKN